MKATQLITTILLSMATLLGGCAGTGYTTSSPSSAGPVYGVVDSIETVQGGDSGIAGTGIGAGTVIGGVVGGLLGSQVGSGRGQDAATVAGAVGGAVAGHEIEKRRQQSTHRIRVRLDNGSYENVTQQDVSGLRIGDRVRIENNIVTRY